ncbi:MAG: acetoacetate decarboxylase family protein [Pseudomonadota bacterium]
MQQFAHRLRPGEARTSLGAIALPLLYHELSAVLAYFAVPLETIARSLPDPRLRAVTTSDGMAVVGVCFFDYRRCALHPYREAGILVPVGIEGEGSTDLPADAAPLHYVHRLPVTTPEALAIGREIWGFPKYLADIALTENREAVTGSISEAGAYDLAFSARVGRRTPRQRVRLRPVLRADGLNIAYVAIEAETTTLLANAGLSFTPKEGFDDPLIEALSSGTFLRGVLLSKAEASLSGIVDAYPPDPITPCPDTL